MVRGDGELSCRVTLLLLSLGNDSEEVIVCVKSLQDILFQL